MRIRIEAASEKELDEKREELIKAIAGDKLDVITKPKGQSIAGEAREPFYKVQKEMKEYWDEKFRSTIEKIKSEVSEVLENIKEE